MTITREQLKAHLIDTRIAGDVRTPRASNMANIGKMLDRRWDYWFGLELDREWTADEVLAVMAKRVGIDPDPNRTDGADYIDPDLTLDALDATAELLSKAAADKQRVLIATGHPTGVLSMHLAVAATLREAGCRLLTPAAGERIVAENIPQRGRIRYLGDVAMLTNGADFLHTHAAEPMQLMLTELAASGDLPDLVLADHGYAGAAAQAGLTTIGLADTNDPALFVGADEGKVAVAVPLDDNVPPASYEAIADYLLQTIRSTLPR